MRPLRRRVVATTVAVTATAVIAFAAPLAYAVQQMYRGHELVSLQRDAVRVAALIPDTEVGAAGSPVPRPPALPPDLTVGVYATTGVKLSGDGPATSALAAAAADGKLHALRRGDGYLAAAPVPSDQAVRVTVLVSHPGTSTRASIIRAWLLMAGLAVAVIGLAALASSVLAQRLSRPWRRLAETAQALGEGDFTIQAEPTGITEVDHAGLALAATARRLGFALERERSFARDASHQLRTPLTGLLLGMESALERPDADLRVALERALRRGRALQTTIDDLLALASPRDTPHVLDVSGLLADAENRWHGHFADRGRELVVRGDTALPGLIREAAARQILDVLLDNALRHGAGRVTVTAHELADSLAVDVEDEGAGFAEQRLGERAGLGLSLAHTLAEASGARLLIVRAAPRPLFRLVLRVAEVGRSQPAASSRYP